MEDRIRELAYLKWEAAGYPQGDGVKFWLQAEEEISDNATKTCDGANKSPRKVAAKATAKRK